MRVAVVLRRVFALDPLLARGARMSAKKVWARSLCSLFSDAAVVCEVVGSARLGAESG